MTIKGQNIMHTPKTVLGFNGELFEPTTGHYLLGNGYRAYSPVLMIFIQPDSWSPFGAGGLNAYAYCEGDPVNAADPTGHMPLPSPISVNGKLRLPPLTPEYIPPGSLISTNMKAFQYFANFGDPSPTIPAMVAVSSLTGLAPAAVSPSRPRSPSPLPSSSSSALPIPEGSAGPSRVSRESRLHKVISLRVKTKIAPMILSTNARGIIALSNEPSSKIPVLRELRWQLLRRPNETRPGYGKMKESPTISKGDFDWLADQARLDGHTEKAKFYKKLRRGLFDVNRR